MKVGDIVRYEVSISNFHPTYTGVMKSSLGDMLKIGETVTITEILNNNDEFAISIYKTCRGIAREEPDTFFPLLCVNNYGYLPVACCVVVYDAVPTAKEPTTKPCTCYPGEPWKIFHFGCKCGGS